jgi:antitoxin ParD1/3/4
LFLNLHSIKGRTDGLSEAIMTTMQVSFPEPLKAFMDELVAEGTFKDTNEYLQTLVDLDRRARQTAHIESLLMDGLDSGPSTPMTPEGWDEIEREGQRLIAARKAKKSR